MTTVPDTAPGAPEAVTRRRGYLAGAWISLILVPVFFFLGFAGAHLPYLIWPYEEGSGEEPLWFGLITSTIFFAALAIPVAGAVIFGRRAIRAGTRWGWLPLGLGVAVAAFFVIVTAVNVVAQIFGLPGP